MHKGIADLSGACVGRVTTTAMDVSTEIDVAVYQPRLVKALFPRLHTVETMLQPRVLNNPVRGINLVTWSYG